MPLERILFDTNVWNYLADCVSVSDLKRAAKVGATRILVAPSTLYEALRVRNVETRFRRAALITNRAWTRLMPEAYSESQELLGEIKRLRPQWLKSGGNRQAVQRLRHDWGRTNAGFWARVRSNPDQEAKYIAQLANHDLGVARTHAYAQRQLFMKSDWDSTIPLGDVAAVLLDRPEGYDGSKIQAWRVNGWSSTTRQPIGDRQAGMMIGDRQRHGILAVLTAFACGLTAAYFLLPPKFSFSIDDPAQMAELALTLILAVVAAASVHALARVTRVRTDSSWWPP
jgi:hypothetical protein